MQENVRNAANNLPEFSRHNDRVRAECSRLASVSDPVTEHWKRPRLENRSKNGAGNTSLKARFAENSLNEDHFLHALKTRATSVTTMPDESVEHESWNSQ